MSSIKITYFNFPGRAEATRLALVIGDVDFDDERIDGADFMKRKTGGELAFGSLPTMTVDGAAFAQSDAMLRYAGKLTGQYPSNPIEAVKVDMVVGALEDVIVAVFADKTPEGRKKFAEEGVPRYFDPVEKMYEDTDGPYLLGGDTPSIADLKLYVLDAMLRSGQIDDVPSGVLDGYGGLMGCCKAVSGLESVVEWNAKHA